MSPDLAVDLIRDTVLAAALIAAPILAVIFAVSFLISLLQTMTSLHDPTVAFVPRLLVGGMALACLLPWMVERMTEFTSSIYGGMTGGP